ncbi:MAG TPA: Wzz/FepE/Etk N-terminal domain-containing protein, partial [Burkholderiales bacterium]|nr:Wzz/FepE/Etk N-terminal domain-containing protein [Burkholderiales bacterium]
MEQNTNTLQDYLIALRRRRKPILLVGGALLLVALAVAFGLPPVYRSAATILIEQQEIPTDLVRSTVSTYADQRIQIISQRVMTSANLIGIIRKFNLYPDEQQTQPTEVLVAGIRKDIKLDLISADVVDPRVGRPVQATIAFSVSYESRWPDLAQKVANELTTLYLNENLKTRTDSARETSAFLTEEAEKQSKQITELEEKLAVFKRRNINKLPELAQMNLQLLERADHEVTEIERSIAVLEERRIYLEAQLVQISPHATVYAETGERILAPEGRLKALESREMSLTPLYAPDHPDLLKLRKELAGLRKELGVPGGGDAIEAQLRATRAELAQAHKKYSPEHPDIQRLKSKVAAFEAGLAAQPAARSPAKPDNPAYVQLQAQLDGANTEMRSQRENL